MSILFTITIIYLIGMLLIGIFAGKDCKNVKDYAIANKKYGTFILVMTFLATSFGVGSVVGDMSKILEDGIIFPIATCGFFIFCLYMIKYIVPRFDQRFDGMISAGDIMRKFYGKGAEVLASTIGFFAGSLIVGSQITGLSRIFEGMTTYSYEEIALVSGAVVTFYSAFGGIKAVTITDVYQAIIMFIVVPLFTYLVIKHTHTNPLEIIKQMPTQNYQVFSHPRFWEFFIYFIVAMTPFLWFYPPMIQRYLMAKSNDQIKMMYKSELVARSILLFLLIFTASAVFILMPEVNFHHAFVELAKLTLSPLMAALLCVMVMAASMSTADSHLNSSAILICHNVIKKLCHINSDRKELWILKFASALIGTIATITALYKFEVVPLIIFAFGLSGNVIGIPIFFAIMNWSVGKQNFYCCVLFSFTALFLGLFYFDLNGLYPGNVAVIMGLFGFLLPNLFRVAKTQIKRGFNFCFNTDF